MWNIAFDRIADLLRYDPSQPLLFNSGLFLFLFVGFYLVYAFLSGRRSTAVRLLYVTAFSYYFYYKNAGGYCALLALITLVNYYAARAMECCSSRWARRLWLWLAVAFMLGQLAYFKYTNFLLESVFPLFGGHFGHLDIFLPLGISFFTFQSMSYIVDVYRQKMKPPATYWTLLFLFHSFRHCCPALSFVRGSSFRNCGSRLS